MKHLRPKFKNIYYANYRACGKPHAGCNSQQKQRFNYIDTYKKHFAGNNTLGSKVINDITWIH